LKYSTMAWRIATGDSIHSSPTLSAEIEFTKLFQTKWKNLWNWSLWILLWDK
jgi:hypothetical protein